MGVEKEWIVSSHNTRGVGTCPGVIGNCKSLNGGAARMARRGGSVGAVKLNLACDGIAPELVPARSPVLE